MIRSRSKKVLLVAGRPLPEKVMASYNSVKQVSQQSAIFPTIHEVKPDVILFDHTYMGDNLEKVLRRIHTNNFYRNIKICCYKNTESVSTDGLLKALGVDHFIYRDQLDKVSTGKAAVNAINNLIDASLINWVAGVA